MFCLPKITSATIHKEKINCQKMFRHHQRHKWPVSNQPKMMLPHLTATKNKSPSRKQPNYFGVYQSRVKFQKMRLNTQNNLQRNFSLHQFLLKTPEMLPKPSMSGKMPISTNSYFFQMGWVVETTNPEKNHASHFFALQNTQSETGCFGSFCSSKFSRFDLEDPAASRRVPSWVGKFIQQFPGIPFPPLKQWVLI